MYQIILAAMGLAGTAMQTYAGIQAGKAQQEALERRAEEEKFAAQTEELKRQEQLNAITAANIVALSNAGIKAEGTQSVMAESTAKVLGESKGVNIVNLSNRLRGLQAQGEMAKQSGYIEAASLLLKDADQIGKDINTIYDYYSDDS